MGSLFFGILMELHPLTKKQHNMKHIKLILIVTLGFVFTISCEPEELLPSGVLGNNVKPGIVVRTLSLTGNTFDFFNVEAGRLNVEFEIQAPDNLVVNEVRIFADFQDNTFFVSQFNSNGTTAVDETLLQTIPASSLTAGRFGFPTGSFSFTYQDLLNATGIQNTLDEIFTSDQFVVRVEVSTEDGQIFTNIGGNSPSLEDAFFASPYRYFATITCPLVVSGEFTIDFEDTFGDGWNGAAIVVINDGEESRFTLEDGSEGSVTFTIPEGVQNQTFSFAGGSFDEEVGYVITRVADGRVIASFSPSSDGPPRGVITLSTGQNPCIR